MFRLDISSNNTTIGYYCQISSFQRKRNWQGAPLAGVDNASAVLEECLSCFQSTVHVVFVQISGMLIEVGAII